MNTSDEYINAMSHLTRMLMHYEGLDNLEAKRIARKMSQEGDEYDHFAVQPPSSNGVAAADAFMSIFGFKRVDEVLSIRKNPKGE